MNAVGRLAAVLLFIVGTSVTVAASPATQPAAGTAAAEQFLRGVYAHYGKNGHGAPIDATVYEQSLLTLIDADSKAASGDVGYLDFDPLCACQDFDIDALQIAFKPISKDRLDATVSFRNFGEQHSLHLTLLLTATGWRITDAQASDFSLRAGLQADLRTYKH